MDKRKPSDVFLELWRARTCAYAQGEDEFRECAEAWTQIRAWEAKAQAEEEARKIFLDGFVHAPLTLEKVHADTVEKVHADAAKKYAEDEVREETESDTSSAGQSPAPSPPGEGSEEVQSGPPELDAAERSRKAYAARKANMRDAMARVRASGVSMQSIADAAGLTLNDVLDFLENKPVPLPKLARLGKALGHMEGK